MKGGYSRKSVLTGITSFLIVLFTMPLGHALMIFMEHVLLIHSSSLCGFHDGSSRSGDGDYWSVCKRRYTTDIMGIIRRTTLLDRMG